MSSQDNDQIRTDEKSKSVDIMSVVENVNAVARQIHALDLKVDSLEKSIKDLLVVQTAFKGTKDFFGWVADTVKYLSIVAGGLSACFYFGLEVLHKFGGSK